MTSSFVLISRTGLLPPSFKNTDSKFFENPFSIATPVCLATTGVEGEYLRFQNTVSGSYHIHAPSFEPSPSSPQTSFCSYLHLHLYLQTNLLVHLHDHWKQTAFFITWSSLNLLSTATCNIISKTFWKSVLPPQFMCLIESVLDLSHLLVSGESPDSR